MTLIHELYADGHSGDSRYRSKLKQKIVDYFPDQLHFLTIDGKSAQVVVSKEGTYSKIGSKETTLQEAAKCLQDDVISLISLPPNLTNFVQIVLKSSKIIL